MTRISVSPVTPYAPSVVPASAWLIMRSPARFAESAAGSLLFTSRVPAVSTTCTHAASITSLATVTWSARSPRFLLPNAARRAGLPTARFARSRIARSCPARTVRTCARAAFTAVVTVTSAARTASALAT